MRILFLIFALLTSFFFFCAPVRTTSLISDPLIGFEVSPYAGPDGLSGVVITRVYPSSQAEANDLVAGDLIFNITLPDHPDLLRIPQPSLRDGVPRPQFVQPTPVDIQTMVAHVIHQQAPYFFIGVRRYNGLQPSTLGFTFTLPSALLVSPSHEVKKERLFAWRRNYAAQQETQAVAEEERRRENAQRALDVRAADEERTKPQTLPPSPRVSAVAPPPTPPPTSKPICASLDRPTCELNAHCAWFDNCRAIADGPPPKPPTYFDLLAPVWNQVASDASAVYNRSKTWVKNTYEWSLTFQIPVLPAVLASLGIVALGLLLAVRIAKRDPYAPAGSLLSLVPAVTPEGFPAIFEAGGAKSSDVTVQQQTGIRDTSAALAAMKLAQAYIEEVREAGVPDAEDIETRKEHLNSLSLAAKQLQLAQQADPDAAIEEPLETGGTARTTIKQIQSEALLREGLTHQVYDTKRAIPALEKATQADPLNAHAFYVLGLVHATNMYKTAAINAFAKALALDPDNIKYRKELNRAQNISASEAIAYKATRAGESLFVAGIKTYNVGIIFYNIGVYAWNTFVICWRIVMFPFTIILKIMGLMDKIKLPK